MEVGALLLVGVIEMIKEEHTKLIQNVVFERVMKDVEKMDVGDTCKDMHEENHIYRKSTVDIIVGIIMHTVDAMGLVKEPNDW